MFGTILVSSILIIIVGLIIYRQIKNRKEGKSTCGCGCSNCAMSEVCHSKTK